MKKTFKRFLSVFLAVLMVITVIPMGVYAAEAEETEAVQVSELEESRDLYSKTYETSEDTNVVISAAVPLHYEKNGKLKDIDNTLVKSEEDSSVLTNKANAYNVELPNKYTDDSEIRIDYEDSSISFKLLNNVKSSKGDIVETENADVDKANTESVAYAESNMDKLSSAITYENLLPDTDFEYNVQPDALKENIILNKIPDADYTVQYELRTGNLEAILNKDNSITLVDSEKKEVFLIESPYMIDANDIISEDVTVSLEKSENAYVLTYTPDYSWLSSEDTAYPVTVDPTITINSKNETSENIEDTYITSASRQTNKKYYDSTDLFVAKTDEYDSFACYLIKNLPKFSTNQKLINATLNLYTQANLQKDVNIAAYDVSKDMHISTLTNISWNSNIKTDTNEIDTVKVPEIAGNIKLNITKSVNNWYSNSNLTKMIILKSLEDNTDNSINLYTNKNNDYRPYLTFEYKIINGIDNTYNYHTQDLSSAGITYINDYTGEMIVERNEISSNGTADDIIFYMGNNVNMPKDKYFGDNASINYFKTVTIDTANNSYRLTNGDGTTKEIFNNIDGYSIKTTTNSENNEIESISISKTQNDLIITECYESGKTSLVNGDFVLTSISTRNNINDGEKKPSTTHIEYDKNGYLDKIYDELISFKFSYNNNYKLSYIIYQSDEKNEELNSIIDENYLDNYIVYLKNSYTYENNGLEITLGENSDGIGSPIKFNYKKNENSYVITNEFGEYYEYTYNNIGQVIKVQEFNSNDQAGDYLTFEYGINSTIISDGTNTYTEYFDNNGNLLSTIDKNGNAVFNNYDNGLITQSTKIRNSSNYIADFYGFESSKDSFISLNSNSKILDTDVKFNGDKSLKLTAQSNKRATFDGNISGLDKETTYTASMWIKNDNDAITDFTLTNGSGITEDFVPCDNVGDWYQYYCTIDTEDATSLKISLEINNTGKSDPSIIYLDNAYVQKSTTVTPANLIQNGEFTNNTESWTSSSNASVIENNETIATADSNCLKLTGAYNNTNTISQTVNLNNVKENDKYVFGAWLKAVNALPAKEGTNREFTVSVFPTYSSDGISSEPLNTITYSTDNSYWQYIEEEIILNSDNINNFTNLSGLKFVISYNYQMGYALVDGVSLLKDELYNIEFEYGDNETIEDVLVEGESVLVDENNGESTNEASSEEGTETDSANTPNITYDYDEYGNLVKTVTSVTANGVTESLLSKNTYGNKGSLLTSSLNRLGYNTKFGYDYFGNIAAVSDANQLFDENGNQINYNTTYYQYDNFQNLSSIINTFEQYQTGEDSNGNPIYQKATLNVKYTYTGSRLDKIETTNIDNSDSENTESSEFTETSTNSVYSFEYDSWGNLIKIFVEKANATENENSVPYIQYEFDENNYHQINSISYMNGQKIQYTYDEDNNLIHQKDSNTSGENSLEYSYFYLDDGTCYAKKDLITGVIETYSDNTTTLRNSDGKVIRSYSYDSNGNTIEQIGNNSVETYTSDINGGTNYVTNINDSENIFFSKYDDLGRISEEHFSVKNDDSYISREYTYYKGTVTNDEENSLYKDISKDITERYGAPDKDFVSSELPRYITYYSVNESGEKTKLYEYRYIYLPNENNVTYSLIKGGDDAIAGETQNEEMIRTRLVNYNSANMVTTDLNLDAAKNASTNTSSTSNTSTSSSKKSSSFLEGLGNILVGIGEAIGKVLSDNTTGIVYDSNGNITATTTGSQDTIYYTYDEATSNSNISNCLTGIHIGENDNISISYDENGNANKVDVSDSPSLNGNGVIDSVNLNWSRGNTLDSIYLNSRKFMGVASANMKIADYKYDDNNLRTHKTIDLGSQLSYLFGAQAVANAEIDYIWNGDKLVGENIDCSGSIFNEFSGDDQINEAGKFNIVILYDNNGNAYGLVVNKTEDAYGNEVNESNTYYYLKDADNTITGLLDSDGKCVVTYSYDTFGTATTDHAEGYKYLMLINPLAYKDYIYDYETGMYYLQSRYYAPYAGRFISADSLLDTGSGTAMCTNAYAYCENDPINNVDPNGYMSAKAKNALNKIKTAITVIIGISVVHRFSSYFDITIQSNNVSRVMSNLSTITASLGIIGAVAKAVSKFTALSSIFVAGTTITVAAAADLLGTASAIAAGYLGLLNSRISAHYSNKKGKIVIRLYKIGTFKINP